jgi:hypothetical protein
MDSTTWEPGPVALNKEEANRLAPAASLYEAFQGLPDARRGQGKRYELALLLCLLVLAKLAGQTTLSGATQWIGHRGGTIADHFGVQRRQMPCQMTYCRLLARIDVQVFDERLAAFFIRWEAQQRCGSQPSRLQTSQGQLDHPQLALDGKTLRATSTQDHPVHLLSCDEVLTGTVLWHCNVLDKQNEISALKPLLTPSRVKGRIFSLDAMHTQRYFCVHVHRGEGDYVLIAKDKQPTLRTDSADLFEDRTPDRRRWQYAQTWDKGHGRLEQRQMTASPDLHDWFHKDWEGIEQVFRLERTVRTLKTGKLHHEVVYGLSSLSLRHAPAARMLELVPRHWASEIVQSQMTKTNLLTPLGGGDHVADLHLVSSDDNAINK